MVLISLTRKAFSSTDHVHNQVSVVFVAVRQEVSIVVFFKKHSLGCKLIQLQSKMITPRSNKCKVSEGHSQSSKQNSTEELID